MSMHGGPAAYFAMRGFTSDKSVIGQKLGRQTINRIGTYAVEFKPQIFFYLVVLVIQSVIVVAQPLLFKKIVDEGAKQDFPAIRLKNKLDTGLSNIQIDFAVDGLSTEI